MEKFEYFPSYIANFFLWLSKKEGRGNDMTNTKLLKLTYFAFAWYYALHKEKLFKEDIEAWGHGPVIPSLYHEFKRFGKNPIDTYASEINRSSGEVYHPIVNEKDEKAILIINAVWDRYKDKAGETLSNIIHNENSPWSRVYERGKNKVLNLEDIEKRAIEAISEYKAEKEANVKKSCFSLLHP